MFYICLFVYFDVNLNFWETCICNVIFVFHYAVIKQYNTIQIWHPYGLYTRNNFPSRGLSLEGEAQGRQFSRVEDLPGVHPWRLSYLFYYTEQNTKQTRGKYEKRRRFWINTRHLPSVVNLVSPVGYSANSVGVRG